MATIKNVSELMAFLEKQLPINLETVGNEVKETLRNNVDRLWYHRPFTPTEYVRTMQYIDSITCSRAKPIGLGRYEVTIYFDTDKINSYPAGELSAWPEHASVKPKNQDVSESIPWWIEEGNGDSPIFSYPGVHPVQTTKDWLEQESYLKKRMIELLKEFGITATVK